MYEDLIQEGIQNLKSIGARPCIMFISKDVYDYIYANDKIAREQVSINMQFRIDGWWLNYKIVENSKNYIHISGLQKIVNNIKYVTANSLKQ